MLTNNIKMKIGNKNHIAFEFKNNKQSKGLCSINFYLGGKLISDEDVFISSYLMAIEGFLNQVSKGKFENSKFITSYPVNCFNTLTKEKGSNESQYFNHLLQIDETIDQYMIFVLQKGENTVFTWKCWDKNNCNIEHKINQIYSIQFSNNELEITLNALVQKLKEQLANNS